MTQSARFLGLWLAWAGASACHLLPDIPDPLSLPRARVENLKQLHDGHGGYRYHGELLGDFGYLIEVTTGRQRDLVSTGSAITNPGHETLVNLVELLQMPPGRSGAADLQIEWCARLVSEDPSELVRERAALGLGEVGAWIGMGELVPPPGGVVYATPEEVAAGLEGLLRSLRLAREGAPEDGTVGRACAQVVGMSLNLDGAWRLLGVLPGLSNLAQSPEASAAIVDLRQHLRETLVNDGVDRALSDGSDRVRTAGLRAMVTIAGGHSLVGLLSQPRPGWSETVVLGIVDLVADVGIPFSELPVAQRGRCLSTLLGWSADHPAERVRVRSMIALRRLVPDGPASLREEDWLAWEREVRSGGSGSS